jgi:hypothetical protein
MSDPDSRGWLPVRKLAEARVKLLPGQVPFLEAQEKIKETIRVNKLNSDYRKFLESLQARTEVWTIFDRHEQMRGNLRTFWQIKLKHLIRGNVVEQRFSPEDNVEKIILNRTQKSGIGFTSEVRSANQKPHGSDLFHEVEPEDLIKFGLIPEFVGRLPVVATLDELDEAALMIILTEPKNALTKQYRRLFEMEGAELEFRDEALRAVAHRAMQRKTGARGLRTILETVLLDTMYELPSMRNVARIVIDETVIDGQTKPYVVYGSEDAEQPRRASGSNHH